MLRRRRQQQSGPRLVVEPNQLWLWWLVGLDRTREPHHHLHGSGYYRHSLSLLVESHGVLGRFLCGVVGVFAAFANRGLASE